MDKHEYRIVSRYYAVEELMMDGTWVKRKEFSIQEIEKALIYLNLMLQAWSVPEASYRLVLLTEVRTVMKVGTTRDF